MTTQAKVPQYRAPRAMKNVSEGPNPRPSGVSQGGTTGGPQYYGAGRGGQVKGLPIDGRQWRAAGGGTSQDRYARTRLPGDR